MKTCVALLATVGVAAIVGCGRELPTSPTQAQTSPATPVAPAGSPEATLTAVSFTVFEYQYGNGPWTYAPRLEVMETQNKSEALVTQMTFTVSGLGRIPPYNTNKCVAPGEQRALLLEFYGDYELEISGSTRATGGSASVVVQYLRRRWPCGHLDGFRSDHARGTADDVFWRPAHMGVCAMKD